MERNQPAAARTEQFDIIDTDPLPPWEGAIIKAPEQPRERFRLPVDRKGVVLILSLAVLAGAITGIIIGTPGPAPQVPPTTVNQTSVTQETVTVQPPVSAVTPGTPYTAPQRPRTPTHVPGQGSVVPRPSQRSTAPKGTTSPKPKPTPTTPPTTYTPAPAPSLPTTPPTTTLEPS